MTLPETKQPFYQLSPDEILDAVEAAGFHCDGHVSALNSYENRVYQIGIEGAKPVIAKFYRPERWTDESILEEHAFTSMLSEQEIPVISPLIGQDGNMLFQSGPYRFSLYPRAGGRAPELDDPEHLQQLGRCLARIHNLGAVQSFQYRPTIDIASYVIEPREFILQNDFIPADLTASYEAVSTHVIQALETCLQHYGEVRYLRIHGDCHLGNILWLNDAPFIVDFDDTRMGPAIQDLWMLLSGDRPYMTARLHDLLDGYCEFRDFDPMELHLLEALRTMRMIHFSGWVARRWDDPAFPHAFPWFNTQRFWEEQILSLKEQLALMEDQPLEWQPV